MPSAEEQKYSPQQLKSDLDINKAFELSHAEEQKYSPQQLKVGPKLVKMSDKLLPGENLQRDGEYAGTQVASPNAAYRIHFQTDGNIVLINNQSKEVRWSPNLAGRGTGRVTMNPDGNLVAYAGSGQSVLWESKTAGHPGASMALQDDGNAVVTLGNAVLWNSGTSDGGDMLVRLGGHRGSAGPFGDLLGAVEWLAKAAASAGRELVHAWVGGISVLSDLAGKIPLVGAPLHSALSIVSGSVLFKAVDDVLHGANVSDAAMKAVHDEVSAVREVAPYARMVISAIPALGSGVNAAIAFASAAVSGVPLDEAMMAGIRGAIPYGEIAKAVYDFSRQVIAGENVVKASVNSALNQLPKEARIALDLVKDVASGANIPMAALEAARKELPPEAQKGLDIGIAIGQGKKMQAIVSGAISGLDTSGLEKFVSNGANVIASTPLFKASAALVKGAEQSQGFKVGASVLNFAGVNETTIVQFREKLTTEAKVGFDLAVSARVGKVLSKPAPSTLGDTQKAAFYVTKGMAGGLPDQKATMMAAIVATPTARAGAEIAITEMPQRRGWWRGLLHFLGLG